MSLLSTYDAAVQEIDLVLESGLMGDGGPKNMCEDLRGDDILASPHFFNVEQDIDRLFETFRELVVTWPDGAPRPSSPSSL